MVSHELKTPLTIVLGGIKTALSEGIGTQDAHMLLQDAEWGAQTMADIVDNLLELSRWQARRLVMLRTKVNMSAAINSVVERSSHKVREHKVVADIPGTLPEIPIDRTRIERILDNLIDNAIKYSPDGGEVRVSARIETDQLVVSVRDQGIGIAAVDAEKLFQPFARLETHLPSSSIKGIGLGLVVCRRLVEAHGGSIWVESEPGKGSVFSFTCL